MMTVVFENLQSVLSQPPTAILVSLCHQFPPGRQLPANFKWQLLAETAQNRGVLAFRDQRRSEGMAWTQLAIEVFDRLAAAAGTPRQQSLYQKDSVAARSNLILNAGVDESHPHQSAALIEEWFFRSLPRSLTELRKLYQEFDEDNLAAMEPLFEVRENLQVLRALVSKGCFSRATEIRELLELDKLVP